MSRQSDYSVSLAQRGPLVRLRPKGFIVWLKDLSPQRRRIRRFMERYLTEKVEAEMDRMYFG